MQHYALTIALSFRLLLLYGVQRCRFKLVQDLHVRWFEVAARVLCQMCTMSALRSVLRSHLTDVQNILLICLSII